MRPGELKLANFLLKFVDKLETFSGCGVFSMDVVNYIIRNGEKWRRRRRRGILGRKKRGMGLVGACRIGGGGGGGGGKELVKKRINGINGGEEKVGGEWQKQRD